MDVLRTNQFICGRRSIDIVSLTGNLRQPNLSVRTSIEKLMRNESQLSVRTFTSIEKAIRNDFRLPVRAFTIRSTLGYIKISSFKV